MGGGFSPTFTLNNYSGQGGHIGRRVFFTHIQNEKPLMDEAIIQGFFTIPRERTAHFISFPIFIMYCYIMVIITNIRPYPGQSNIFFQEYPAIGIKVLHLIILLKTNSVHGTSYLVISPRNRENKSTNYLKWTVLKYRRNNIGIIDAFKFPHN